MDGGGNWKRTAMRFREELSSSLSFTVTVRRAVFIVVRRQTVRTTGGRHRFAGSPASAPATFGNNNNYSCKRRETTPDPPPDYRSRPVSGTTGEILYDNRQHKKKKKKTKCSKRFHRQRPRLHAVSLPTQKHRIPSTRT